MRTIAESITVRGVDAKIRSSWGAFALAIVTLGIYYFVWYYKINRELRDFGRASGRQPNPIKVHPFVSLLAVSLGGIVLVPAMVSWYRTFARIETAQEIAGLPERVSPGVGFLLFLVALLLLPFEIVYAQRHLNKLWRHELARRER